MTKLKLAILDLYKGTPNQGMRCIREILETFEEYLDYEVFDVRCKNEVPDTSFDIYISTGGPGSPFDGNGIWEKKYYSLIDQLWNINAKQSLPSKFVFFICHSFQLACIHFKIGDVCKRKSMSFGTFPVHKTAAGKTDPVLKELPDPFWAADFRHFQVINPNHTVLNQLGAEILALEKIRPQVNLERAIMAVRFSDAFLAVQFHPEADPDGMVEHFLDPERRKTIIDEHKEEKYLEMIDHLRDPDKIAVTHNIVLPTFLTLAIKSLKNPKSKSSLSFTF
jgi:homoserine O-succinyltransferase